MDKKHNYTNHGKSSKRLWITFLFFCIITTGFMQAANKVFAQATVTASFKNATLSEILWEIQRQTDFTFVYSTNDVKQIKVQNLNVNNEKIANVLDKCLMNSGLTYSVHNGVIAIKQIEEKESAVPQQKTTLTGTVLDETGEPIIGANILVKGTTNGTQTANIMFLIQQANLRNSELNSDDIKEFHKKVAEINADTKNYKLNNIEISAYASPDGGVELNTGLAENREANTEKYMERQLKKGKIDTNLDAKYTAQDWEGFQELVSKSNLQDKDLILRVLSMYNDPEQREAEIKNISSVYKTLADEILPQLRRARLTANYDIIGRSDDEINEAFNSDPKVLSVEELLYAATLTNDNARKEAIFTKTTQLYPNDFRAYNNLGELAFAAGDAAKAESYFKQAASKNANAPEVNANLGLCELVKGNVAAAETYLGKATGANAAGEALGNLYIKQGQYDRAVNSFGDAKTNSAAQAQILAKDYNKAKATLSAIKNPDAMTDYLMAIVGANNASLVSSSIKSAIAKDPSMAEKAANDREFAKYADAIK